MCSVSSKNFRHLIFYSLFMVCMVCKRAVYSVTISDMHVPDVVQNGSETGAVLDCMYHLDAKEFSTHSGLVVKWFFNRSPNPVYQWIHNKKPQDAGILKGRLKLDYKASNNHSSMYRALKIIRPTIELSGEYKCLVSTYHDEDFMMKTMIVYVPERRMDFFHSRQDSEKINVSCRVEGVYPQPKLFLYKDPSTIDNKGVIEDVSISTVETRSGTYDVTTSATFLEESLGLYPYTVFDCEMQIPGTHYTKRKTFLYFPGGMKSLSSVSAKAAAAALLPFFKVYSIFVSICCVIIFGLSARSF